ncbi:MAG: hypothetical protein HY751_11645 [Nitrospinae bacterium]|nr:hypothetical protein [Nitrospinota bacterium]
MNEGCQRVKAGLWEMGAQDFPEERKREIEAHLAQCPACALESGRLSGVKNQLSSPPALDEAVIRKALAKTQDSVLRERATFNISRKKLVRWFTPLAGAMAAGVILAIALMPRPTAALSMVDFAIEHAQCVMTGHFKGYECATMGNFNDTASRALGVKVALADGNGGVKFVRGGICRVKGVAAAHAVYEMDGKMVSCFCMKNAAAKVGTGGASKMSDGLWSASRDGDVVIMKTGEGEMRQICVGAASHEKLTKLITAQGDNGVYKDE